MKKNLILLSISTLFSILILEMGLRWFTVFPIHSTSNTISDDKLGYKLDPVLKDVDEAGFRNPQLMPQADIVALGDSHTQGFNVASEDSWPQQLARKLNKTIYNLGIGGYGILQYQLLLDEAIKLKPKYIILGLYLPNDYSNVCETLRGVGFWTHWAQQNDINLELCPPFHPLYQKSNDELGLRTLIKNTAIGSMVKYFIWDHISMWFYFKFWDPIKVWALSHINPSSQIIINDKNHITIIKYDEIMFYEKIMDINSPNISLGFEIAKEFMREAKRKVDFNKIQFLVLFIPSKETVFYNYLTEKNFELPPQYHQLVKNETELKVKMSYFLDKIKIEYVDVFPYLVEILNTGQIYPSRGDDHPLQMGYEAYAKAAYDGLMELK